MTVWTATIVLLSLAAGFFWARHHLRQILESDDRALLNRKAAELTALAEDSSRANSVVALDDEIRREVDAFHDKGLILVLRRPETITVQPQSDISWRFAERVARESVTNTPSTFMWPENGTPYLVKRVQLAIPQQPSLLLDLGIPLEGTEATVAQFSNRVAGGVMVFILIAFTGGHLLARQAMRPVAASIRTAQQLKPTDLNTRLPQTGAGDEIDQLAETINQLLDRLAAYHDQMRRFTADASHEMRGPLAAMRAAVDVVLQQPRTADDYRDVLSSLGEQCERLTALVNALLLLAKTDSGQVELNFETVDLAFLVGDVVDTYLPLAEDRGIALSFHSAGPVVFRGDTGRIRQLASNLIDNALKFTNAGGQATVSVENGKAVTRLIVRDTGVGVDAWELPHIFERFYQADAARSGGGVGLGLSICRWIVEAHGGQICATSDKGQGTVFVVDFEQTVKTDVGM